MGPGRRVCVRVLGAALLAVAAAARASAPAAGNGCRSTRWLGAWAASPTDASRVDLAGHTLRITLTPLIAGERARVRLSNRFGIAPLILKRAFIGRQRAGPRLEPGSNEPLRFDGRRRVTIAPGREAVSDPVEFEFQTLRPLAVSAYVGRSSRAELTRHFTAMQTSWVASARAGDVAGSEGGRAFAGGETLTSRPLVTGLDVRAPGEASAVVAFGDSLTDGLQAPGMGLDLNRRYPDFLARRLAAKRGPQRLSVLNAGISGNSRLGGFFPSSGRALSLACGGT